MSTYELNKRIGQLEAIIHGLLTAKFDEDDTWTQIVVEAGFDALKESTFYGNEYKSKNPFTGKNKGESK